MRASRDFLVYPSRREQEAAALMKKRAQAARVSEIEAAEREPFLSAEPYHLALLRRRRDQDDT